MQAIGTNVVTRHGWLRLAFSSAATLALGLATACSGHHSQTGSAQAGTVSSPTQFNPPHVPYVVVDQLDASHHKLKVRRITSEKPEEVDVTGLSVDFNCAQGWWDAPESLRNLRLGLLRWGCAEVTGNDPMAGELAAQNDAKQHKRGRWANPPPPPPPPPPPGPNSLLTFLRRHWVTVASLTLGVLGLVWVQR